MVFRSLRFGKPGPIFIIGSYRSATSALTWAMGQHPNVFPLEETHFLYKLSVDLEYLYRIGSAQGEHSLLGLAGYTPREFREHFGQTVHDLVTDAKKRIAKNAVSAARRNASLISDNVKLTRGRFQPKRRWVDGTPENSHYVLPLLRMFPDARFIHVLRNPKRVATSLMNFSTMGATDYAEEEAYRTWYRLVHNSALAEQALGPKTVMRLDHEELVTSPEHALRKCLEFAGERFHPHCLLPLREKLNSSRYDDPGDCSIETNLQSEKPWIREAFELFKRLSQGLPVINGDRSTALRHMKRSMDEYVRGLRPETNERLAAENLALRQDNETLQARLKRLESPMSIVEWGPQEVMAGAPFNPQPNGSNALWIRTRHAAFDTVASLNDVPLATTVHPGGDLVTIEVPPALTAMAGPMALTLRSMTYEESTPPVNFTIHGSDIVDSSDVVAL